MNIFVRIITAAGKIALSFVFVLLFMLLSAIPIAGGIIVYLIATGQAEPSTALDLLLGGNRSVNTGLGISQSLAFIGGTVLMYVLFDKKAGWPLGWRQHTAVKQGLIGSVMGVALITVSFCIIWLLGGLSVAGVQADAAVWKSLGWSLLLFVLVAISEELFSRGYVQGLLKHLFNTKVAIVVSTVVFTFFHAGNPGALANPIPLLNIFLAGLLLSVSREVSGGLWLPIGIHLTWNYFQGNVYGFAVSGMEVESIVQTEPVGHSLLSGGSFGAEGSLVVSVVMLAATYSVYKFYKA